MRAKRWLLCFAAAMLAIPVLLGGCTGGNETLIHDDFEEIPMISPITLDGITAAADIGTFIEEVDYSDGTHNNEAKDVGTVLSPYFALALNDTEVPCYAVRTSAGAHSFAMADVTADAFPLTVSITADMDGHDMVVLPQMRGITADISGDTVTAVIEDFGSYSFSIDGGKRKVLTLFIREKEIYVVPDGYTVTYVPAGTHEEKLAFTGEKQVLYFDNGIHYLKYNIDFLDNTEVYLAPGAHVIAVMPDMAETPMLAPDWAGMTRWNAVFQGDSVENVRITGRGYVDLSQLDWHARSAVRFDSSENVTVSGITMNNSPEWTVYFTQCENITVEGVMLFGYRQNSDGICLVDSRNALVKNCFARSGDDLFEVKSMYGNCSIEIGNIRFEDCHAWPDKARGLGIIAESVRDIADVHFVDCSVGHASAEWMDALGSLVVYLTGAARVDNISFENIELYKNVKYPINVTLEAGATAVIENVYFENIDIRGDKAVRIADNSDSGEIRNLWFDDCTRDKTSITDEASLITNKTNADSVQIHINET